MTRARRTPTQLTAPLPARIRAALATGWHSLSALDALAGGAASTRRARVHAALAELAGAGMVREERMGPEGVEVREAVGPVDDEALVAPVPDGDRDGAAYSSSFEIASLSPIAAAHMADLIEHPPAPTEALRALLGPVPAPDDGALAIEEPAAPKPGPFSRCAVCNVTYASHWTHLTPAVQPPGHPFAPRKRGTSPGPRQRRTPGPIVDVASEARIERAGGPRLAPVGAEGREERRMREWARLDTRPAPTEAERAVVAKVEAAVAAAALPPAEGRCTPPECHYDRINDPARVPLDRLPPLCAAHRGWVEAVHRDAVEGVRRVDE